MKRKNYAKSTIFGKAWPPVSEISKTRISGGKSDHSEKFSTPKSQLIRLRFCLSDLRIPCRKWATFTRREKFLISITCRRLWRFGHARNKAVNYWNIWNVEFISKGMIKGKGEKISMLQARVCLSTLPISARKKGCKKSNTVLHRVRCDSKVSLCRSCLEDKGSSLFKLRWHFHRSRRVALCTCKWKCRFLSGSLWPIQVACLFAQLTFQ